MASNSPIILFDGACSLCSGSVTFILRRDRRRRFRFAALQSPAARRLLGDRHPIELPDSLILLQGGRLFTRSAAALRIARQLRFPWPCFAALWLVPRPLRDWAYDVLARRRHRWFGRRDACLLPDPRWQELFLE